MTIKKVDIALAQLETALDLFLTGGCLISVTTLAGAAEEILGRLLEKEKKTALAEGRSFEIEKEPALTEIVRGVCLLHKKRCGTTSEHAPIKERANFAKNSFKHMYLEGDLDITVDVEEEAIGMLNRATDNYWKLKQHITPLMERYDAFRRTDA